MAKCVRCNGTGSVKCNKNCDNGTIYPYFGGIGAEKCKHCSGKGEIACPVCNGKGEVK